MVTTRRGPALRSGSVWWVEWRTSISRRFSAAGSSSCSQARRRALDAAGARSMRQLRFAASISSNHGPRAKTAYPSRRSSRSASARTSWIAYTPAPAGFGGIDVASIAILIAGYPRSQVAHLHRPAHAAAIVVAYAERHGAEQSPFASTGHPHCRGDARRPEVRGEPRVGGA